MQLTLVVNIDCDDSETAMEMLTGELEHLNVEVEGIMEGNAVQDMQEMGQTQIDILEDRLESIRQLCTPEEE